MRTFAPEPKATQQAMPDSASIFGRTPWGQSRGAPMRMPAANLARPTRATNALKIGPTNDASERAAEDASSSILQGHKRPSQPNDNHAGRPAPRAVYSALASSGNPLQAATRTTLQPHFRADLHHVRVHHGEHAAESASSIQANAFTAGRDIVFGADRYQPSSIEGQRLIAHELTHVDQQAATGPSVQRQPASEAASKVPTEFVEIFEALEKEGKKPLGVKRRERLRKWALEYEQKVGKKADLTVIRGALTRWRVYGSLPEIKTAAEVEAEKFTPPVPCNEIIPYKVGTKLLVTHLFDKVLPPDKAATVQRFAASQDSDNATKPAAGKKEQPQARDLEEIIRAHPSAIFSLIMSKDVPKSATGVITESSAERVQATVNVPAIPSKGGLPAFEAFTANMSLEFNTFMGSGYDLRFTRETAGGETKAFAIHGLQVSKSAAGLKISVGKDEYFKVRIAKGQDNSLKLQVFEINTLAKTFLGLDEPLTLVNVVPTAGPPAAVKQKEQDVRSEYQTPPAFNRPKLMVGSGVQWLGRPDAFFSMGWKFTFSPGLGVLQVPLAFEVEYSPKADFFGKIYSGVEGTIPSQVPVTLSLIGGVRAGSVQLPVADDTPGRVPIGGPLFGLGAGVQIAPPISLQLDAGLMLNALKLATDVGPTVVPTLGLMADIKL